MNIDSITGKTYATHAEQQVQYAKALQCPYPHLAGIVDTTTDAQTLPVAGSSECRYVFSRGYDLWRHLRTTHQVEVERDDVDQWVKSTKQKDGYINRMS